MMGPTHVAVGAACALAVAQPTGVAECLVCLAGGALGGMICDIDCGRRGGLKRLAGEGAGRVRGVAGRRDLVVGWVLVLACLALWLLASWQEGNDLRESLVGAVGERRLLGLAALAGLCVAGYLTRHRSFTHSVFGLALMTGAVWAVFEPLALPFACGMVSHVVLDLLNAQPVRLLYPAKHGFCLRLFKANGIADAMLLTAGVVASAAFVLLALVPA